jgi:hypothetical protein
MYCRNCGNEVHEKAVACPKCGVNPRTEKKFCPNCGKPTAENQVLCVNCGVSLATPRFFDAGGKLVKDVDWASLLKKRPMVLSLVALLGCLLPWSQVKFGYTKNSFSYFQITKAIDYLQAGSASMVVDTILYAPLLMLLPLSLAAIIASYFVPQIEKYRKLISVVPVIIIVYFFIGMYLTSKDLADKAQQMLGGSGLNGAVNRMAENSEISNAVANAFSIGLGCYFTVIASILIIVFVRKEK